MRGVGADDRDGSRSVEEEGFVGARVGREADAYEGLVRGNVVDELGVEAEAVGRGSQSVGSAGGVGERGTGGGEGAGEAVVEELGAGEDAWGRWQGDGIERN